MRFPSIEYASSARGRRIGQSSALLILILFLLSHLGGMAHAGTFVIDVNFDGINPASACEQPAGAAYFTTFATAFAATAATIGPPHSVRVCPGAYSAGTFIISSVNQVGMRVVGTTGGAASVVVNGGAADIFDVRQADVHFEAFTINNGRFAIETNAAGTGLTIDHLVINDSSNDSVRVLSANPTLINLTINNAGQDGIELSAAATGGRLESITVARANEDCIQLDGDDTRINRVRVDSCTDIGLETRSDRLQITQARVSNVGDRGLFIAGMDVVLDDIQVDGAQVDGIQGTANADNARMTNVTIRNAVDECMQWQGDGLFVADLSVDTCGDHGVQVIPTGGGSNVDLSSIDISNTTDDGLLIQGVTSIRARTINVTNSSDRGITLNNITRADFGDVSVIDSAVDGIRMSNVDDSLFESVTVERSGDNGIELANGSAQNSFRNIRSTLAIRDGLSLNGVTDTSFTDSVFLRNGDDGISLVGRSDRNVFENVTVNENDDEGITFNNTRDVTIRNSVIDGNANDGIQLTNNSRGNLFEGNLIENNGSEGAILFNTGTNTGNIFSNNCFSQTSPNATDGETAAAGNAFDNGVLGNYYGSVPAGSGFSDTCPDADANNICDTSFSIPGAGGSVDRIPLVSCGAATSAGLTVSKSVSVLTDPVNEATNPKAIPGAVIRYTITIANSPAAGTQPAEETIIDDDLDNQITTLENILWVASSMRISAPSINGGSMTTLSDAVDGDEGEFDDSAGNRTVTARCGDLLAGESCVLTFDVTVQ